MRRPAFSLLEVLIVIGIISIVLSILVPSLVDARRAARSTACKSNLKTLIEAVHAYASANSDAIVPSYNMTGVATGIINPLDGWGPILDRFGGVTGSREMHNNPFCCPDTLNIAGMSAMQTGSNPDNPKGYMDWPAAITLSQNFPVTIPTQGFDKIIRVGYWINGDNPLGVPQTIHQGIHFTGSVGYGPDPAGQTLKLCSFSRIGKPSELIALADGLYAGKQERTRLGDGDSRIGYRHAGQFSTANIAFADGHVGSIDGRSFPRKWTPDFSLNEIRNENLGGKPTIYANPAANLLP